MVRRAQCFAVPEGLSDDIAAALPNPGVSAWLTLKERAKLAPGETVLILGATGITGKLAVQIAKILGAERVVAAGRNRKVLDSLLELGADTTIQLDKPREELTKTFAREARDKGFQVVIDYLWGQPTEALLAALTRNEFAAIGSETRLVQVGESADAAISLPAAVLRSTPLTIMGTAGMPAPEILLDALQQVLAYGACGKLRIDTERVPLADIESAWQREGRSRLVDHPVALAEIRRNQCALPRIVLMLSARDFLCARPCCSRRCREQARLLFPLLSQTQVDWVACGALLMPPPEITAWANEVRSC